MASQSVGILAAVARPLRSAKPMFWTADQLVIPGVYGSTVFSRLCIYITPVPAR